ncbi:MAG: YetF domain-containing protein [Aeromicrobium sp.]|uniref:DUF421 domain-containing protein n=1 Tax=Aeromicrobium sp. TaxID=1871063 RepID=UPI003C69B189
MFFDSFSDLLRVIVVTPLAYVWLVVVLRISGKRTLAQLNAFDFIVTVALGSTLATVLLSSSVAWTEGATALGMLTVLQFVVAMLSVRVSWFRRLVTSTPSVLLRDGQLVRETLMRERVSEASVHQAVRQSGFGGLEHVALAVLENNGSISVIPTGQRGSGSALL